MPQVSSIDHAAYPVWSRGTLPNTTFFLTPLPRVPGSSGMRLSLVWGQTVSDVDIVVVTSCGQVFWNTRLRAIGGVAIRQDNDFTTFNGVEVGSFCLFVYLFISHFLQNVKFLDHLPCGFYEVYIRVLGKGATFDSRTAKVFYLFIYLFFFSRFAVVSVRRQCGSEHAGRGERGDCSSVFFLLFLLF